MRILLCAAGATLAMLIISCGSGNSTPTPANVRDVNAASTAVSFSLNGGYPITVASNSGGGYQQIPPGTYTAGVASANGTLTSTGQTLGLGTAQNYTVLAYQRNNVLYEAAVTENLGTQVAGYSALVVGNVATDAGALDVYVAPAGLTSLATQSPTFQAISGLSTPTTIASTNPAASPPIAWDIWVTGAGSQTDIRLVIRNINFISTQAYTLGLTGTAGGALVNGVLIPQAVTVPAPTFYPATEARVRVMSALSTASKVSVTVGSTTLPNAYSPNPTPYTLVAGGSAISSLVVTTGTNVLTIPNPSNAFTAGNDYTVLLYGDGATAAGTCPLTFATGTTGTCAVVFTDDNELSTNSAAVRLINGGVVPPSANSSGVTMYVGGLQAASGVAYGSAAPYFQVQNTGPALQFTFNGDGYLPTPVIQGIVSGAVYTAFIYSSAQPPLIFRDR